jgi:uncharacterized membrane protein
MAIASKFTGVWTILGLLAYYLHERLWNAVHWGKEKLPVCIPPEDSERKQ